MKKQLFFLLFFICEWCLSIHGEPEYTFKRLTMTEGMVSNYIVDIIQDNQGNIWLASESGLCKFDGINFTPYNSEYSVLGSNALNVLFYNKADNTIWIGTQRNGISIFNCETQTFTPYGVPGMITQDITDLSAAADGGIWITHYHLGIDYYSNQDKTITHYKAQDIKGLSGHFWCAKDDGNGHLYVGLQDGGLAVIDIKHRTAKTYQHNPDDPHSIPNNTVRCIFISKANTIWVGTGDGLALFNPQKEQFISFQHQKGNPYSLLSNQVNDIGESWDGKLWVCTQMGGVSILDVNDNVFTTPENTHFQNIRVTNNLHGVSSPNVKSFLQDSFGNIWLGNYRGGVDFLSYNRPAFQTLAYNMLKDGSLTEKQVWGLTIDNESRIWIGGEDEVALFNTDMELQKILSLEGKANPHTHVSVIFKDKKGLLWLGLYKDGVLTCNPQSGAINRIPMTGRNVDVRCFYEDNHKLWIGTQNGLYAWENDKITEEKEINAQLPDLMVHGIQKDRQGKLWLGTFGKGLIVFSPEGKRIMRFDTSNGMASNAVNSLYMDKKGGLWATTRAGIVHISDTSNPQLEVLGQEQGLIDENVRAIMEDNKGEIWISTNAGISQWKSDEKRFLNYTWHQGVPRGDFMDGSVCKDKNGNLFFGSQNGVCYFNPERIEENVQVAPVRITGVTSYGHSETDSQGSIAPIINDEVRLSYQNSTFTLTFSVMDYTQCLQVEYAYNMEGLGKTWFETGSENRITFRNLQPGEYTFKVKAKMRNQPWGDEFTSIHVVITPPIWLTWYAKLCYLVIVAVILFAIVRFYKRKLELESRLNLEHHQHENDQKLNNEWLRFYTNITHELRTPLTLILGPLEDLLADKTLSGRQANKISLVRDSANRLLNLINQILEFRKTETENRKLKVAYNHLAILVQEIGIKYKELNQNPNVDIQIKTDGEEGKLYYDREIITIIIDNLMSNALKYTPKGTITLGIGNCEENGVKYTTISVEDTGHGISKESLNHIFERYYQGQGKYQASGSGIGLALVKSLADLHQATIEVESEVEKGSRFTLKLLTENTYPNAEHQVIQETSKHKKEESANVPTAESEEGKPIILVVEDNRDIREYIRCSFKEMYEVLTAADGKEGWEITQNRIPNIVISDIMMPVMDGIELCRHIKEDMRTSHIPVILLTAKDTLQDKEEGYAAGADSFITKPFSARLLNSRINNILENRRKIAGVITSIPETESEQKHIENERKNLNKLDQEFLNKVTAIIEENLSMEKMDVAFIADKMCMSHSTLYRKIKGLMEMSVNEFVRKIKMKKGMELINSGQYSLAEVSDLTGFSSVAYFRQCFKDEYGMAPTEYLKRKQN
jgi:signal transduction histidine kinase/ligand-binding sensor domain-containing protein/DNA-binding response OmpR family regulator